MWVCTYLFYFYCCRYGFYCVYDDTNNHAEVFIDNNYKVLASHAVVGGVDQGWQNANLPGNFINFYLFCLFYILVFILYVFLLFFIHSSFIYY